MEASTLVGPSFASQSLMLSWCLSPRYQRRIMLGGFVLSESSRSQFFDAAQVVRGNITRDFQHAFASGVRGLCCRCDVSLRVRGRVSHVLRLACS